MNYELITYCFVGIVVLAFCLFINAMIGFRRNTQRLKREKKAPIFLLDFKIRQLLEHEEDFDFTNYTPEELEKINKIIYKTKEVIYNHHQIQ